MFLSYLKVLFILTSLPILLVGYVYLFRWLRANVSLRKSEHVEVADNTEESPYEQMRKEREDKLNSRVEQIKKQIADNGIPAKELHPNVKNIPHDQVMVDYYPDVEESD